MNLAYTAMRVAETLQTEDVVYLADDEQQAEALAAAVAALTSPARAFFLPSSDALPGDVAPASPANAGNRVAALRRLRLALQVDDRPHLACILSGEAAARLYPAPEEFDTAPPRLSVGDAVDIAELSATLEQIGYVIDGRVDEPGEMRARCALRGSMPVRPPSR